MLIKHDDQPETRGCYSRIINRRIVGADEGVLACTLWDQIIPAGGYITPHQHPTEELLTFLSGRAVVTLAGREQMATENMTLLVPAGVSHSVRNDHDRPVRLLAYFPTADPQVVYAQPPTPVNWEESE